MATNVLMPQLGESIAEGTIVRWNKRVGDTVDRDEPLFEVSTDKVDAEVPSPAGGVVADVCVEAGETVAVGRVVAIMQVTEDSGLIVITEQGKLIRVRADGIRKVGRSSQGVKLINLNDADRVAAATLVASDSGKVENLPDDQSGPTVH